MLLDPGASVEVGAGASHSSNSTSVGADFLGVASAVAPLLALGVDVQPSSRLRSHGSRNIQDELNVAEPPRSRLD